MAGARAPPIRTVFVVTIVLSTALAVLLVWRGPQGVSTTVAMPGHVHHGLEIASRFRRTMCQIPTS